MIEPVPMQASKSPVRVMSKLKDLRGPRSSCESSSDGFTTGLFGVSEGLYTGIDETEGELGIRGWLDFEPLERADVRIENKGLLAINRRAMLGDDGALLRRSRIEIRLCDTFGHSTWQ